MKIYIVGPVRGVKERIRQTIADYVKEQEYSGHTVYWSQRNTDQEDPTGYRICTDNATAIQWCDRVDVFWTGTSRGSLFDLGIAWALGKELKLVEEFVEPSEGKCFQRVLREWERTPPTFGSLLTRFGCLRECESREDLYKRAQCKLTCLTKQLGQAVREVQRVKAEFAAAKGEK